MRGIPKCPDCGADAQTLNIPPDGDWWRCPWATAEHAIRTPVTIIGIRGVLDRRDVSVMRCDRPPARRETLGGHFLTAADRR